MINLQNALENIAEQEFNENPQLWCADLSRSGDGTYFWYVINTKGEHLESGYTDTKEYAVMAARNYMKNNQNLVWVN